MDKTIEPNIHDETYEKMNIIYTNALYNGSFGDNLKVLNFQELSVLLDIAQNFLIDHERILATGFIGRLIKGARKSIANMAGENDIETENVIILKKLKREIQEAFGKHKPANPEAEKHDNYMEDFLTYLSFLDEREKGPNATNLKIRHYVIVGPKQIEPKVDQENKVIISFRMPFAENLAFIKEHMNEAVILNNLRETDARLRRKNDDY